MSKVQKEAEESWDRAIRTWSQNHGQIYYLILPVFVNLMLTLAAWIFVYEMRVDKSPVSMLFFDRMNNRTTGNDFYDGMLNGFVCVGLVAVLSFIMLGLALYNFRRLVQCWLSLSCLLIMFCVASTFFTQLMGKFNVENVFVPATMTLVYGTIGVYAFFTTKLPPIFHQFYVITNCSLVSLFYLQILPNHTTWFLLSGIVLWDIFAVLTPLGPLRQVTEKAKDYSEDVLRFLMFSTTIEEFVDVREGEAEIVGVTTTGAIFEGDIECSSEESSDSKCIESDCDQEEAEIQSDETTNNVFEESNRNPGKKTAHDALNDSSARLGLGDFVFYSFLVGKSAVNGSILATLGAIVGIITGLVVTLTVLSDGEETTPALPVSIFLGMSLHFGILYLVEPLIHTVMFI